MEKKDLHYRKINNHIAERLSLSEIYTYLQLAMKSDYKTFASHIGQKRLGELTELCPKQVGTHLTKMDKLGLIEKLPDKYGTKLKYKLLYDISPTHGTHEHWVSIDIGLLDKEPISKELKAFLTVFKICCYNYTNRCDFSSRGMEEYISGNIKKSTIDKYRKQAIELGYIKQKKDKNGKNGYYLTNADIFIIPRETDLAVLKGVYPEVIDPMEYDDRGHLLKQPIYDYARPT